MHRVGSLQPSCDVLQETRQTLWTYEQRRIYAGWPACAMSLSKKHVLQSSGLTVGGSLARRLTAGQRHVAARLRAMGGNTSTTCTL